MDGRGVATGALVAGGYLLVDGGEQRAGAAGEVADAEAGDGGGVGPVEGYALTPTLSRGERGFWSISRGGFETRPYGVRAYLGYGEAGQEGGGGGKGVEGGEVLAVRY